MVELLYTIVIGEDLVQYEIFRAKVCDFWKKWCMLPFKHIVLMNIQNKIYRPTKATTTSIIYFIKHIYLF